MVMNEELERVWSADMVVVSFLTSFIGALCAVSLNDVRSLAMARGQDRYAFVLLAFTGLAFGGVAIFSMHFVGMAALTLRVPSTGEELVVDIDLVTSLASVVTACGCTMTGAWISSKDAFFNNIMTQQQKGKLTLTAQKLAAGWMGNYTDNAFLIRLAMVASNTRNICIGGAFTSVGVITMHYLGMTSMHGHLEVHYRAGIVAAACAIGLVVSIVAMFIIYRLLTFWRHWSLRIVASFVAATAVCAMHYTVCTRRS
jgi:NO-binding membrane sensor protein with MHYT domain